MVFFKLGTSNQTNPNAMKTIQTNTIFTNVGQTADGRIFWEGLEKEVDVQNTPITTWLGERFDPNSGKPAAHPNSRFCTPAFQCPIIGTTFDFNFFNEFSTQHKSNANCFLLFIFYLPQTKIGKARPAFRFPASFLAVAVRKAFH